MSESDRRGGGAGGGPRGGRGDRARGGGPDRRGGGREFKGRAGDGDRRGRPRRDDRPGEDRRRSFDAKRQGRDEGRPRSGERAEEQTEKTGVARPELDEHIEFSDLDMAARKELRGLPKELAEQIGKHLVAAGQLVDSDPQAALAHARFAKSRASRIPIVREANGIAAYHAGEWAEALSELRAVRRMTREDLHVAIMADAERALGRPERALDLMKETDLSKLPPEVATELRIVAAGARRDLGQLDAAVVSLQGEELDPSRRQPWSARLFYAYADNLLAVGRNDEAATWFVHAAEADMDEETDAAERAAELGR